MWYFFESFWEVSVESNKICLRVVIKSFMYSFEKQQHICLHRSTPYKTMLTFSEEILKMIVQGNVYTFFQNPFYQYSIVRQAGSFQLFLGLLFWKLALWQQPSSCRVFSAAPLYSEGQSAWCCRDFFSFLHKKPEVYRSALWIFVASISSIIFLNVFF